MVDWSPELVCFLGCGSGFRMVEVSFWMTRAEYCSRPRMVSMLTDGGEGFEIGIMHYNDEDIFVENWNSKNHFLDFQFSA